MRVDARGAARDADPPAQVVNRQRVGAIPRNLATHGVNHAVVGPLAPTRRRLAVSGQFCDRHREPEQFVTQRVAPDRHCRQMNLAVGDRKRLPGDGADGPGEFRRNDADAAQFVGIHGAA